MLLETKPLRPFSRTHVVQGFCGELARVRLGAFGDGGGFMLDGEPYGVRRERPGRGAFVLEGPGGIVAQARKPTVRRLLAVTYERRRLTVEPAATAGHVYVVREGLAARGVVQRRISPLGRRFEAELAPDVPLPVQVFIAWLVLLVSRRPDLAATSWGGASQVAP